jgi:hypothetical protein
MSFQVPAVPPGVLKYARPSDIVTALAVITCSQAVSTETGYGLPALYDGIPARPCKILSVGPARVVYDFGSARRIDAFALPNHNLAAGTVCQVAMNATDSWGAPTVNASMTVGAQRLDGHRASPWVDLTTVAGYTTSGLRYLSLNVPAQSVEIKLGETLAISELRRFSQWTQFGTRGITIPFLESLTTEYGVQRVYRRRVSQRTFDYRLKGNAADVNDLRSLMEDAGGLALPWFVVADSDVETDGGLMVRFTKDTAARLQASEEWFDLDEIRVAVEELSRSIPLS